MIETIIEKRYIRKIKTKDDKINFITKKLR